MQHLSTAFLIFALVIVVNGGPDEATNITQPIVDQFAEETKNNALSIVDGPKYVAKSEPTQPPVKTNGHDLRLDKRPPSKPPIYPNKPAPNYPKIPHKYYVDIPRPYYQNMPKLPPRPQYSQPLKPFYPPSNSVYNYPKVVSLPHHKKLVNSKQQLRPGIYTAPNNVTVFVKSPKFSLPVQTITGVRTDNVKPPRTTTVQQHNTAQRQTTISTTATTSTTTKRPLRTKRIWPKKILEKMNATNRTKATNDTISIQNNTISTDRKDHDSEASIHRIRYVFKDEPVHTSEPPKRVYRPVTRNPKKRFTTTTTPTYDNTTFESDWIPIVPPQYLRGRLPYQTRQPTISKRSDIIGPEGPALSKRMMYLQSFGLVPVPNPQTQTPEISRKKTVHIKKKLHNNPYSGYSANPGPQYHYLNEDLVPEGSHHHHHHGPRHSHHHPRVVTKVKHHHHHHHHKYIKTVEKPVKVPYKVEVPKPYPVPVEKRIAVPVEKIKVVEKPVPYPVTVEKKVPYPIGIKVPHPVPYKVIEKEYVPKPYPVVHHVPVLKHVQVKVPQPVPVHVEKKVPYPVEVKVPVDRPVPVHVTVEKQVPYPVPVKVLVPQPYPVETKVPYPVEVKVREPFEVIKHVHVKVPYPQPFAVKVPQPYPVEVEKRVPYPVEVEKKVPVPVEVLVPQKVEVEKKVPVYIPKPYPVEKKVPVPVKVPYPVKVPVQVPVKVPIEVPIYIHNPYYYHPSGYTAPAENDYGVGNTAAQVVTGSPHHTVTVHGNTGFAGFHSRSDNEANTVTTPSSTSS